MRQTEDKLPQSKVTIHCPGSRLKLVLTPRLSCQKKDSDTPKRAPAL